VLEIGLIHLCRAAARHPPGCLCFPAEPPPGFLVAHIGAGDGLDRHQAEVVLAKEDHAHTALAEPTEDLIASKACWVPGLRRRVQGHAYSLARLRWRRPTEARRVPLTRAARGCRSLDWTSAWLDLIAMDAPRDHSVNTRHNDPITPSARHGVSDPYRPQRLATMDAGPACSLLRRRLDTPSSERHRVNGHLSH
jgi:hypothetical protein